MSTQHLYLVCLVLTFILFCKLLLRGFFGEMQTVVRGHEVEKF